MKLVIIVLGSLAVAVIVLGAAAERKRAAVRETVVPAPLISQVLEEAREITRRAAEKR